MKKIAFMMFFVILNSTIAFAGDCVEKTVNVESPIYEANAVPTPAEPNASDYIDTYYNGIESNSKGKVTVHADIDCKGSTAKNRLTITLCEYLSNGTTKEQTKTKTTTGIFGVFDPEFSVTSGNDCDAIVTYEALSSTGRVLDKRVATTKMITAK